MKKILIINGHPNAESFCFGLAEAYKIGARKGDSEVKEIIIRDLSFNPNLHLGYREKTDLEPDLIICQEKIKWADHLVWVHPVWWGGLPAITIGFIDRVFLPGFAFQYKPNSIWWDMLLKGKTAHIITTLDQPGWYYHLVYGQPSVNQLKKTVLDFCGIKPIKVTFIGPIRNSTPAFRNFWLKKVEALGTKNS